MNEERNNRRRVIFVPFEINSKLALVTYILVGLNVLTYAVMVVVGLINGWSHAQQLWMFGGLFKSSVNEGEYWRLLTCMFLHASLLHLATNCYALWIYGRIVEKFFGRAKLVAIYLIAGLTSSMLSYLLNDGASVGASGAIFGLLGAILYFGQKNKSLFKQIFGWKFLSVVALNLLIGFVIPEIDIFGHIGGLIGGYLAANAVGMLKEKNNTVWRILAAVGLVAMMTCCMLIKIV